MKLACLVGLTVTMPLSNSEFLPKERKIFNIVLVSRKFGTLLITQGSSVNKVAASIGNTAFLEPETTASPCNLKPPSIISLSITFSLFCYDDSIHIIIILNELYYLKISRLLKNIFYTLFLIKSHLHD